MFQRDSLDIISRKAALVDRRKVVKHCNCIISRSLWAIIGEELHRKNEDERVESAGRKRLTFEEKEKKTAEENEGQSEGGK